MILIVLEEMVDTEARRSIGLNPYCPLTGYHFQQSNVLGREKGKISNYYINSLVHLRPSYVHKCYTIHTLIILFLTQRNICST